MGRINLYRNISIFFIVLTAMILTAIFLIFYSKATIIVTSEAQNVNVNFVAEVNATTTKITSNKYDVLDGEIATLEFDKNAVFYTSSTRQVQAGNNLVGKVVLYNTNNTSQRLVRTTQLQGEDGVIVRTDSEVNIPAGGNVEVAVFPKEPQTFSGLNPGKLTIIKLPTPLQEKIYGEAKEKLAYSEGGEVNYISESDINRAKQQLIEMALQEISASSTPNETFFGGELIDYSIDKKLGDEAKSFTLSGKVRIKKLILKESQLTELIQEKGSSMNLNGLSLGNIDMSQIKFQIIDGRNQDALVIKVSYSMKAYLTEDNEILAKGNFINKEPEEIRKWASQTGAIKNIEVFISPYWRSVTPQNEKRIKIIIK